MKILIHYRHFPVAIGRYFDMAFRDLGHEVFSVGCYNGGKIPWGDEFDFPEYDFPPDLVIPEMEAYPLTSVLNKMPWKPDIIIQASDTTFLSGATDIPNVILATDPHCINYLPRLANASHFACMQKFYMERYTTFKNKFWVPYAYLPSVHINQNIEEKEYDVVFIGLQYDNRKDVLEGCQQRGLKVFSKLGILYSEFADVYNKGKVAFNFSSKLDLPARFFEGMAMGNCMVTNHVPDLDWLPFSKDHHYLSYQTKEEAVDVIERAVKGNWKTVADQGFEAVTKGGNTYQDRCNLILKEVLGHE